MNEIAVIGSGFSGLASASFLAREGFNVTVFEKNSTAGGRARKFEVDGFNFDMGPSWYWMPEIFDQYFAHFGKTTSEYYQLKRLDPSYRIYFAKNDWLDVPAEIGPLCKMFDDLEPGSSESLVKFLADAKFKYDSGMNTMVHKPGLSFGELLDPKMLRGIFKLDLFQSMSDHIRKYFRDPRLIKMLEFPVLFLGASPDKIPALYSLMNYADMSLGTWYPMGGMYRVIEGMKSLALDLGVNFRFDHTVDRIEMANKRVKGLWANKVFHQADYVVASADYHHVEQNLLPEAFRTYSPSYWQSRVMAPSCLLFFVGVNKKIKNLCHHNLFFDQDFSVHTKEIYDTPKWPTAPQFYLCCPSKTDSSIAPEGYENLFILVPVAPGLEDDETTREKYFTSIIHRIEKLTGNQFLENIIYKKSYAHNDFIADYNAFRGNAYGLANTLMQTANLKPRIANKNISNLFYTGQLTVPGPGVPPSLISGQVVAKELMKRHQRLKVLPDERNF
jgi:phytoene desaturase